QPRVCGDRVPGEQLEVRDHVLVVGDQHPLPLAATVTDVVDAVHRSTGGSEPAGDVLVPPQVLAVPVAQQRDPARVRRDPGVCVQCATVPGQLEVGAGGIGQGGAAAGIVHVDHSTKPDHACRALRGGDV